MPVYSVSQVSSYMKDMLERDFLLQDLLLGGEVSNLARPASGHSYFSLRDAKSTLRCVMFRNSRGSEYLDNGVAIVAHGRASIYEARGDLQLIIDVVQPEGVGELQLKLEQLKLKLENEGLFEPSRKRELPEFPLRIAVVTSPTGAVCKQREHDLGMVSKKLTAKMLASYDCVLIATDHSAYDYGWIVKHAHLILDTRNATANVKTGRKKIVKA